MQMIRKTAIKIAVGIIRSYQLCLSPLLPMSCRYLPTCSEYAIEAMQQHGVVFGSILTIQRICSCHPFGGHGYDPVPRTKKVTKQ